VKITPKKGNVWELDRRNKQTNEEKGNKQRKKVNARNNKT